MTNRGGTATSATRRRGFRAALVVVTALVVPLLGACAEESSKPTLTWYINPDNGGQKRLAEKCAPLGRRRTRSTIQVLPNDASQQREQLVRRLAAQDSSIDVMSLDPPFVAEFANAGFLRPFDEQDAAGAHRGRPRRPAEDGVLGRTSSWRHRSGPTRSCSGTARRRWPRPGSTPPSPDFTWDQMIEAAVSQDKVVGCPGQPVRGLHGLDQRAGASRPAGRSSPTWRPARTPHRRSTRRPATRPPRSSATLARSPAAPPAMSTAGEEEARSAFQGDARDVHGQLAVRLRRRQGRRQERGPRPVRRRRHRLGPVPRGHRRASRASPRWAASTWRSAPTPSTRSRPWTWSSASPRCRATSSTCSTPGNPAAKAAAYDDPKVRKAFPMAAADPRVDQRGRAAADHAVLQRRLDVGADHLAPQRRRPRARRRRRRPPPS